jgi:predicted nucleic acid-binding protein
VNYLDTSALIKRFVAEPGSELVRKLVTEEGPVATAKIAYAEAYAAFNRKKREGHLSRRDYGLVSEAFENDWQAYVRVDLQEEVLAFCRELTERHPLRGFDAIHLASALSLQRDLGEKLTFAAADARLLEAAAAEDLLSLDVENPPVKPDASVDGACT